MDTLEKKRYWPKTGIIFAIIGFVIPWGTFVIAQTCARLSEGFSLSKLGSITINNELCSYTSAMISSWNLIISLVLAIGGFIVGAMIGVVMGNFAKKEKEVYEDLPPQDIMAQKVKASLARSGFGVDSHSAANPKQPQTEAVQPKPEVVQPKPVEQSEPYLNGSSDPLNQGSPDLGV